MKEKQDILQENTFEKTHLAFWRLWGHFFYLLP